MKPIEPILDRAVTPHNPGQNTNPTTSHVMSHPNPPGSSAPGEQHSIHVLSIPSSAVGKPPALTTLFGTEIVSSQGHTSGIEKSIVYVPPTHTNVVNLPYSLGHTFGAQPIRIYPYQGSEVDIKKMCSFGNESSSMATSSSVGNSAISSAKTKDFLDLAD